MGVFFVLVKGFQSSFFLRHNNKTTKWISSPYAKRAYFVSLLSFVFLSLQHVREEEISSSQSITTLFT